MEDISKLTRKEREKLQRRSDILDSATKLFAEKGFNSTTLEDIAVKSEFGIGTIYNYFQSKEEIFRSIIEKSFHNHLGILISVDAKAKNTREFFETYTRQIVEYCISNQDEFLMLVYFSVSNMNKLIDLKKCRLDETNNEVSKIMNKRIISAVEKGEIREFNPERLSLLYHNLVFPYITHLIKQEQLNRLEVDEHINLIIDVLFNGIIKK